jgi:hypothetical protein
MLNVPWTDALKNVQHLTFNIQQFGCGQGPRYVRPRSSAMNRAATFERDAATIEPSSITSKN